MTMIAAIPTRTDKNKPTAMKASTQHILAVTITASCKTVYQNLEPLSTFF
jgi:hypothetical protein